MKRDTYYKITGLEEKFFSLREAKMHLWYNYTRTNISELSGSSILKYVDGEAVTETPIIVRNDGYCFCKTVRL